RFVRASDFDGKLGEGNNPEWKTVALDETSGNIVCPLGSIGFRWGEQGKWNLEEKAGDGRGTKLALSLLGRHDKGAPVAFPYFGGHAHEHFVKTDHPDTLIRNVPVKVLKLVDGETLVASVYDLFLANYGIDRGLGGEFIAKGYDDDVPYTPAWAEKVTGVKRH